MHKLIRTSSSILLLLMMVFHFHIAKAANDVIHPNGVGKLHIGMTVSQIEQTLKARIKIPKDPEERECFYFSNKAYPKIHFMLYHGRLGRIDVQRRVGSPTIDGIAIGDPILKVKTKYGSRLKIEPHVYSGPEEKYLTVYFDSGRQAIRFETYDGLVSDMYAGKANLIKLAEGCS